LVQSLARDPEVGSILGIARRLPRWEVDKTTWQAADVAVEDKETLRVAMGAIAALPPAQQTVIRMRDVEGYTSEEVCAALDVSEGNQRVLLHRARSRVRAALEEHLDG
jgi:RNA polymerase sigma-70 factor (ECF subfamily)